MSRQDHEWRKTVFRVRGLPGSVQTFDDVASFLSCRLRDCSKDNVHVFSVATTLGFTQNFPETPISKTSTVMFDNPPVLVHLEPERQEWCLEAEDGHFGKIILDVHFIGMTPLNDVELGRKHMFEYVLNLLLDFQS